MNPNTTMSWNDILHPEIARAACEIWSTMDLLRANGLRYSSWWGTLNEDHVADTAKNKGQDYVPWPGAVDDINVPWFSVWEYAWIAAWLGRRGDSEPRRILDLGGASSPLSALLASQGHRVFVYDRNVEAVGNAQQIGIAMDWDLDGKVGDFLHLDWFHDEGEFDLILSVSALFVVAPGTRRAALAAIPRLCAPRAIFAATFDFQNPNINRQISDPESQFCPPGFSRMGEPFSDRGERQLVYHPDPKLPKYTMGAIFFEMDR